MADTVYLKAERNVEVTKKEIFLKDIAKLTCVNPEILAKVKAIKIVQFKEKQPKRAVISVLKIIELIQQIDPKLTVESIGETDIVVEMVKTDAHKSGVQTIKTALVALISFFGTAFTIMAFHNDIGIEKVFQEYYELLIGEASNGFGVLEISYSIGLSLGIIVFFNHIGGRRITKDPTPIEVEMRLYENDVNTSLIETSNREGTSIDVD